MLFADGGAISPPTGYDAQVCDFARRRRPRLPSTKITGLSEGLPLSARKNTAAVAAAALLEAQGEGLRVELEIHKGIPSSGGMGGDLHRLEETGTSA